MKNGILENELIHVVIVCKQCQQKHNLCAYPPTLSLSNRCRRLKQALNDERIYRNLPAYLHVEFLF